MKVGQFITFSLETWNSKGVLKMKVFKSEIIDFCVDPLDHEEVKCSVIVNDQAYGIPICEIIKVYPAINEQLLLF